MAGQGRLGQDGAGGAGTCLLALAGGRLSPSLGSVRGEQADSGWAAMSLLPGLPESRLPIPTCSCQYSQAWFLPFQGTVQSAPGGVSICSHHWGLRLFL